jgi:hypothetical protein
MSRVDGGAGFFATAVPKPPAAVLNPPAAVKTAKRKAFLRSMAQLPRRRKFSYEGRPSERNLQEA